MKIRHAEPSDVNNLAEIHWISSAHQEQGFMYLLGKPFFQIYYKIMLGEKGSVILCARDDDGKMIGFVSGSIDASEHMRALKKNRFLFLIKSFPVILKRPHIIISILSRLRSTSPDKTGKGYIVTSGPRLEYWGWLPDSKDKTGAIELLQEWLITIQDCGVKSLQFEVDLGNSKIFKIHRYLGSKVVREFATPDGRKRAIMQYTFD